MQEAPLSPPATPLLLECLLYGLVSALALAVDMTILRGLVDRAGWNYLIASTLAFSAGASFAYVLSIRFVFRLRRLHNASLEFASFFALGLVGLLVNAGALFVGVSMVGLGLVTAKLLAAGCTFATNFTLRRRFLFSSARGS